MSLSSTLSPTTGGWMFVSTAVPLSLKLNYACNFTRRIRTAEQIRAERGDKFRLVKKRWKIEQSDMVKDIESQ